MSNGQTKAPDSFSINFYDPSIGKESIETLSKSGECCVITCDEHGSPDATIFTGARAGAAYGATIGTPAGFFTALGCVLGGALSLPIAIGVGFGIAAASTAAGATAGCIEKKLPKGYMSLCCPWSKTQQDQASTTQQTGTSEPLLTGAEK